MGAVNKKMEQIPLFEPGPEHQKRAPFAEPPDIAVKGRVIRHEKGDIVREGDRITLINWNGHVHTAKVLSLSTAYVELSWSMGEQVTLSMRTGRLMGGGRLGRWRVEPATRRALKAGWVDVQRKGRQDEGDEDEDEDELEDGEEA